jgi:predicted Zn-dependent peptidase
VGSALETDSVRGASHMIEHMCFQGTSDKLHSKDIFREYDKIGAYLNAFTMKDYTTFKVNCDILHIQKCIHVLSDIMIHSKFNRTKFYKEQKVVVEENHIHENDANNVLSKKMEEQLYLGSSYSFPVDTIEYHSTPFNKSNSLSFEKLEEWYHWYYVPSNMIFSIVSSHSFSKIISILEKSDFVKTRPHPKTIPYVVPSAALPTPILSNTFLLQPTYVIVPKKGIQTNHVMIGFRTCGRSSPEKYIFKLISHMISGPIGRLYTLLRETHNLAYGVRCYNDHIPNMGYFIISVETDPKNVIHISESNKPGVIPLTIKTIQSIVKKGFRQHEIDHSKGYLHGKTRMQEEDIDVLANYNGREWILSNYPESSFCTSFTSYSKIYDTFIKPITKTQIQDVVSR